MSLGGRSAPGSWPQDPHSTGLFLQQTFLVPPHLSQRHQMLQNKILALPLRCSGSSGNRITAVSQGWPAQVQVQGGEEGMVPGLLCRGSLGKLSRKGDIEARTWGWGLAGET